MVSFIHCIQLLLSTLYFLYAATWAVFFIKNHEIYNQFSIDLLLEHCFIYSRDLPLWHSNTCLLFLRWQLIWLTKELESWWPETWKKWFYQVIKNEKKKCIRNVFLFPCLQQQGVGAAGYVSLFLPITPWNAALFLVEKPCSCEL